MIRRFAQADIIRAVAAAAWAAGLLTPSTPSFSQDRFPITGRAQPAFSSFDEIMQSFMREHRVPGAALALSRDGRVVYARGFGWADRAARRPVEPDALFRIASISKPITAVAVLQLVEQGKVKLDQRVLDVLRFDSPLPADTPTDERWRAITIADLLHHRGGWDRNKSFDPMFEPFRIGRALRLGRPPDTRDIIRYMLDQPLQFDPGRRFAYSNFGYCVLGRVIEDVTGQTYDAYVREHVLSPIGIRGMRLGRTLPTDRFKGEVSYNARSEKPMPAVVGARPGRFVSPPDGGFHMEVLDAHGGWAGSATDLVRFAAAFDDHERCKLLGAPHVHAMISPHNRYNAGDDTGDPDADFYGGGWFVRRTDDNGDSDWWHSGGLQGSSTLLVRRHDGWCWAVLFNSDFTSKGQPLTSAIAPQLNRAIDAVRGRTTSSSGPK